VGEDMNAADIVDDGFDSAETALSDATDIDSPPLDSGPGDATASDVGVDVHDASDLVADEGIGTADIGPPEPTPFVSMNYAAVPQAVMKHAIKDIVYLQDGTGRAVLGGLRNVGLYTADGSVQAVADLGDFSLERVAVVAGFDDVVIAGGEGDDGRLLLLDLTTGTTSVIPGSEISGFRYRALVPDPTGGFFALAGGVSGQQYLQTRVYHVQENVVLKKAFVAGAGLTDAVWVDSTAIYGEPFLLILLGINGADSRSYIGSTTDVLENGWMNSFGNPGRAAWRPAGSYGMAMGTSSNKAYLFDGSWTKTTLPVNPTFNAVAFSPYGNIALLVGRPSGNPLGGTVVVHRNSGFSLATGTWEDWSIPGFDQTPYSADSNTHLLSVAFQPGSDCGEGLIGTMAPNNSTIARLIRFTTTVCP